MLVETEVSLDFKDVLIRPKRSTLSTRSNVDVSRDFQPQPIHWSAHHRPTERVSSLPVAQGRGASC